MPGLSLLCSFTQKPVPARERCEEALSSLLHDASYRRQTLLDETGCQLAFTGYEGYPFRAIDDPGLRIFLEGRIYGRDDSRVDAELTELGLGLFRDEAGATEKIRRWLLATDGDFVVIMREASRGRLAVLSDVLGRLPIYWHSDGSTLFLSREIAFVSRLAGERPLDRLAIAESLLLRYPTGERTLLAGVRRLPPATLLRVDPGAAAPSIETLHRFNFEAKEDPPADPAAHVEELVSHFTRACGERAGAGQRNVLCLSGGLDSRTVAAGLQLSGAAFSSVSFLNAAGKGREDAKVAARLAEDMGMKWRRLDLPAPRGETLLQLLRYKGGLVELGLAFLHLFYETLRSEYGPDLICFTGDGGDKVLPDLRPPRKLRSREDALRFLVARNGIMPLATVSALTRLSAEEILADLATRLDAYPEQDWNQKYVHFIVYERAIKWLFEGEDRNRLHSWSVAPCYGLHFFRAAMSLPDPLKTRYALYRQVLTALSPRAAAVPDANLGVSIAAPGHRVQRAMRDLIGHFPGLQRALRRSLKPAVRYGEDSTIARCLRAQMRSCASLHEIFDRPALDAFAAGIGGRPKLAVDLLFTMSSAVEMLSGERSSLENFRDAEFD